MVSGVSLLKNRCVTLCPVEVIQCQMSDSVSLTCYILHGSIVEVYGELMFFLLWLDVGNWETSLDVVR